MSFKISALKLIELKKIMYKKGRLKVYVTYDIDFLVYRYQLKTAHKSDKFFRKIH